MTSSSEPRPPASHEPEPGATGEETTAPPDRPAAESDTPQVTTDVTEKRAVPEADGEPGSASAAGAGETADGSEPATDSAASGAGPDASTDASAESGAPDASTGPAAAPASPAPTRSPVTTGSFEAYSIGDPGRAFTRTVSLTETKNRDSHDIVIDAATVNDPEGTPRLVVRAASSRGLAHQQYGDPRQDDHCFVLSADGEWLVCLVADGVSAGEWSHLAAKVATEEGAADVANLLATADPVDLPWREVLQRLADQLADVCATLPSGDAVDIDLSPREVATKLATTLLIGVVATRPDEDGTHAVAVVRLGDSSGWILDDDEGWVSLGDVKNAGNVIAESATACLPLVPEEDPVVVETTLGDGAALVLMTDGVGDPLGSGAGEVGTTLAQLWSRPPHPVEFAAQVAFGRKTFDDDRAALVVWLVGDE